MVDNALRAFKAAKGKKGNVHSVIAVTQHALKLSLRGETLFRRGNPV